MDVRVNDKDYVMDNFTAVGVAEGFIDSDGPDHYVAAWQQLVLTGQVWQLQGWFGRTAQTLIKQGIISSKDNYDAEVGIYYEPMLEEYHN